MLAAVLTGSYSESVPDAPGGIQIAEYSVARELANLLPEVAPADIVRVVCNRQPGQPARERLAPRLEFHRIRNPLPFDRATGVEFAAQFAASANSLLSEWCLKKKIQIVQQCSAIPAASFSSSWVVKEALRPDRNLKFVYVAHNSVYLTDEPQYIFRTIPKEWKQYRSAEIAALESADLVLTASPWFRARILEATNASPDRVIVIPNTIGRSEAYLSPIASTYHTGDLGQAILFVGRLAAEKHIRTLIEVAARVFASTPEAALIVCGDGPERPNALALCRALGLRVKFDLPCDRGCVHFLGHVSGALKWTLYKTCGVFCCLSDIEVSPLVGYEALACGIPAVVTDIPPWRELVSEGVEGHLTDINDPETIALRISELLSAPTERARMSKNAHSRYSTHYDSRIVARRRWEEAYRRLLG